MHAGEVAALLTGAAVFCEGPAARLHLGSLETKETEAACGDQKGPLSKERAYFWQSEAALESGQQVGRHTPVILKGLTERMNQNKLKTGNLNTSHKQQQQQKNTLLRPVKEI